jgi:hypothetical protein
MIQTPEGVDRGIALYRMYPGAVTNMCTSRKSDYYQSKVFKGLQNRCKLNDQMIDNVFPFTQAFISDIAPPIIRKAYKEFKAVFGKFMEQDPLFSVARDNQMPVEREQQIQSVLSDNMQKTYFREKCLTWLIDSGIRYGTAVAYTFASDSYNAGSLMTIRDDSGMGDYKQVYSNGTKAAITTSIHPLNFYIDPRSNYMVAPDWMGFIGDICIANLATIGDNLAYIGDNLRIVLKEAKEGLRDEYWYGGPDSEKKDFSRGHTNISYLWTRLPIEGNEDDPTWYAVEMVGSKIIRIEENVLENGIIPLSICRVIPRPYVWNGNSPLEEKTAIQNMMNWLINTEVESTAKLMDRMVIVREGGLDIEAINSRHKTGGFVFYRGQEPDLSRLIYSPQMQDPSFRNMDWLVREMRQEDQETSPVVNLQNQYNQGGLNNKTLGAAQMVAGIGEMLTGDMVNNFCIGLKDIARHQLAILNALNPDDLQLNNGNIVPKSALSGDIPFTVKTSNIYNYARTAMTATNTLTQAINYRATQIPEFNTIKIGRLCRDWLQATTQKENVAEYLDLEKLAQMEQQAQMQQQPAMPPAAPGGAPAMPPPQAGPMPSSVAPGVLNV